MKKIVSMIAGILVLISAAVTAGAEKISIANEKYPAPGYAGAVFGGTVEDSGDSNNFSLFSAKESSACDYIYKKLWDLEWSRNNIAKRHYEIKDSNGDVVESGDDYFVEIPLTGYSVSKQDITTIMNFLVNEKGELLLRPLYMTSTNNSGVVTHLYIPYAYDVDTIETKREEIKKNSDEFISSLGERELLTERERVLLTHDFIANKAHYAPSDINNTKYHTLYSALVEGVTVCQGYTQAMCYILPQIGVECVSCLHRDAHHVWNCVKVDNQWSHVDVTWDDARAVYNEAGDTFDFIKYSDFMINAETMIANKLKGYNKEDYSGNCDRNEFTFPSGKLTLENTDFNSAADFAYKYINNFNLKIGKEIAYFLPSGFKHENGSVIHTLKVLNGGQRFDTEYKFIYNGVMATNSAVSVPIYKDSMYSILILPLKSNIDLQNDDMNIYMAEYNENNITRIQTLERKGGLSSSNGMHLIKISDDKGIINNSDQAKFFFWDSNMRPYTQPTYKSIQ